jgi:hypothetical protein
MNRFGLFQGGDYPDALPSWALPEQLQMAGLIDVRVKAIAKSGVDDLAIFTDMTDYLPAFKRLMDTSTADDMDQVGIALYRVLSICKNP